MYLINFLSLQRAEQLFVAFDRLRTAQGLIGPMDGVNVVFHTPDAFVHNLPFASIHLYLNGLRVFLLNDYTVSESGGPGTGFDTVVLVQAPLSDATLFADYLTT